MGKISRVLAALMEFNLKTIYFNFKYFPFAQAIYMPVFICRHVKFVNLKGQVSFQGNVKPRQVRIGYKALSFFDHNRSRSILDIHGHVIFEGKATIGHGSKLAVARNAELSFGDRFVITAESSILCTTAIKFGSNCLLSWDIYIMDTDFHKILNEKKEEINCPKPINFGNDIWIGCRCLILKGANIPNGSIIAANTTVGSKPLTGENRVFGGSPLVELKNNVTWA
jgi:hypothetical protein